MPPKDKRGTSPWISIKNDLIAYAFMAPYLFLFIVFLLLPAAVGVYASFTKWGIIGQPKWVGLKNYTKLVNSELFIESLQNTLYFVILAAIPLIVLGFLLALLVHQKLRGPQYRARHRLPAACCQRGGGGHHISMDPGAQLGIVKFLSGRIRRKSADQLAG